MSKIKYIDQGAVFSDCRNYRYVLYRIWDRSLPNVMAIGLNPSTANAQYDDCNIEKLVAILQHNGYGGLTMTNLFGLISNDHEDLRKSTDPVRENDVWLKKIQQQSEVVVFCWGALPQAEYRARKIIPQFPRALCLGRTDKGNPRHPLYLKRTTKLIPYAENIHSPA